MCASTTWSVEASARAMKAAWRNFHLRKVLFRIRIQRLGLGSRRICRRCREGKNAAVDSYQNIEGLRFPEALQQLKLVAQR
jgi:hypothetical protein